MSPRNNLDLFELEVALKDWLLGATFSEKLGSGATRHVYAMTHRDDLVLKVEGVSAEFCNVAEFEIWNEVKNTKWAKYFAPVHGICGRGAFLIMERTQPITKEEFDAEMKKVPNFLCDIHWLNFGRLNGRIVCHDYGYNLAYEQARRVAILKAVKQ